MAHYTKGELVASLPKGSVDIVRDEVGAALRSGMRVYAYAEHGGSLQIVKIHTDETPAKLFEQGFSIRLYYASSLTGVPIGR